MDTANKHYELYIRELFHHRAHLPTENPMKYNLFNQSTQKVKDT